MSSSSLHDEVVAAVDRQDPAVGVVVVKGRRVLADRDPLTEESGAVLVVLDPPQPPDPPDTIRADARRGRQPPDASAKTTSGPSQGSTAP